MNSAMMRVLVYSFKEFLEKIKDKPRFNDLENNMYSKNIR